MVLGGGIEQGEDDVGGGDGKVEEHEPSKVISSDYVLWQNSSGHS